MAAQQTKAWFTATPATSEYDRFSANNIPSQDTFEDLLETVLLKTETATDSADVDQLGYVEIVSDADALSRTDAGALPYGVPLPHHLPLLVVNGTELDYGTAATDFNGLTYEVVEGDDDGRASFRIEFTPTELSVVAPAASDYVIFMDTTDSGLPKKALISTLLALGEGIWERDGDLGEVSLINASDDLALDDADIHFGDAELDNGADRTISVELKSDGAGKALTISAGTGTVGGGALSLFAGTANTIANVGGDVNISGGAGTTEGNVLSCWTGSVKRGLMSVGGAIVAATQLAVYGKVEIVSGGLEINGAGVSALDTFVGLDANNIVQERTKTQFHVDLFGAVNRGDILYDNGTNLVRLPLGTEGYFLSAGANDPEWAEGFLTDEKVKVTAGTAGYLDDVLVEASDSGISLAVSGDTLEVALDINSLEEWVTITGDTYIAVVDPASVTKQTKKVLISELVRYITPAP